MISELSYPTYTLAHGVTVSGGVLTEEQCAQLTTLLDSPRGKSVQPLNGRGNVIHANLSGIGNIVVKQYMRGGWLRVFVQKKYLKHGPTRGEVELNLLNQVRQLGVKAPEPVAYMYRGWPFYDAWLVMKEIENQKNFAELSIENEVAIDRHADEIVRQISILIKNRIFHVDLHPGNVLVQNDEKIYLLDFDKAYLYRGAKNRLRDQYLVRWRRAVIKHNLPEALAERVCPGLRRNFET